MIPRRVCLRGFLCCCRRNYATMYDTREGTFIIPLAGILHGSDLLSHPITRLWQGEDLTGIEQYLRSSLAARPMYGNKRLWMHSEAGRGSTERETLLTARQREVLQLIAEGRTMKEAAAILNISPRTADPNSESSLTP